MHEWNNDIRFKTLNKCKGLRDHLVSLGRYQQLLYGGQQAWMVSLWSHVVLFRYLLCLTSHLIGILLKTLCYFNHRNVCSRMGVACRFVIKSILMEAAKHWGGCNQSSGKPPRTPPSNGQIYPSPICFPWSKDGKSDSQTWHCRCRFHSHFYHYTNTVKHLRTSWLALNSTAIFMYKDESREVSSTVTIVFELKEGIK